jgi:hypothetical protein
VMAEEKLDSVVRVAGREKLVPVVRVVGLVGKDRIQKDESQGLNLRK